MAVTINADTTNGLVLTPDTSGDIKLQSAGADIATVSSTGITMASGKTLPASALTGSLPAGMGGKIVQAVHSFTTTAVSSTSTTPVDTTLNVDITPTSASNKILIFVTQVIALVSSSGYGNLRIYRDTTNLRTVAINQGADTSTNEPGTFSFIYEDSPATTSTINYKTMMYRTSGGGTFRTQNNGNFSSILALEVAS